jgi:hypothetical protein
MASPYDAITGQAFAWRDMLREWGNESEIVAEHVHSGVGLVDGGDLPLALHELASSTSTRSALYDVADRRLAELKPDVLAPRIRKAVAPLLGYARRPA